MVREERRRRAQQQEQTRPIPQARPVAPQSLNEYLGKETPPMARPVPVPVAQPVRGPVAHKPAPPVIRLRRPKAAFAKSEGPTIAADQAALIAHSKARVEVAAALAGPGALKPVQGRAADRPLVNIAHQWDRTEAAKAIVGLELFGVPRAVRPYSGPPLAE